MNKARLEYEMNLRGVSRSDLCKILGISRSAFYRKCNGISEFTQGEIQKIMDYLSLETPVGIFLTPKCLKRHKRRKSPHDIEGGGGQHEWSSLLKNRSEVNVPNQVLCGFY